jgi:hypothetical protein
MHAVIPRGDGSEPPIAGGLPPHARPPRSLPLGELEALAGLRTAGLLALDRARVAREQAEVAQLAAVRSSTRTSARAIARRSAPACPVMPPPSRCAFTSKRPSVSVAVNGCWIALTSDGRGK